MSFLSYTLMFEGKIKHSNQSSQPCITVSLWSIFVETLCTIAATLNRNGVCCQETKESWPGSLAAAA